MQNIKVGKRLHVLSSNSPSHPIALKGCHLTFHNEAAMMLNNYYIDLLSNSFNGSGIILLGAAGCKEICKKSNKTKSYC